MVGYGEGAPVHIGQAVARRCGPTLVIKVLRRFEVVCAWRMLLASWRRVSTLASLFDHHRERAHSFEGCPASRGEIERGRRAEAKLSVS